MCIRDRSGICSIDGLEVNKIKKNQIPFLRRKIGVIFQDFKLLSDRSIYKNLEFVLKATEWKKKSKIKERVDQVLNQVGMIDFKDRYPHELSGGQRQRVIIARAIAVEPKVLICDESVAALDISVQAQVLNLLNNLKRDLGLSYLFISHDLAVVKYMSDRIMVMQEGKLIELQEADELYKNPKNNYTKRLIDAIP